MRAGAGGGARAGVRAWPRMEARDAASHLQVEHSVDRSDERALLRGERFGVRLEVGHRTAALLAHRGEVVARDREGGALRARELFEAVRRAPLSGEQRVGRGRLLGEDGARRAEHLTGGVVDMVELRGRGGEGGWSGARGAEGGGRPRTCCAVDLAELCSISTDFSVACWKASVCT